MDWDYYMVWDFYGLGFNGHWRAPLASAALTVVDGRPRTVGRREVVPLDEHTAAVGSDRAIKWSLLFGWAASGWRLTVHSSAGYYPHSPSWQDRACAAGRVAFSPTTLPFCNGYFLAPENTVSLVRFA